tara:strand:- start:3629 stop:3937 length:309 start_codon:yes stop_codon:yes gene_type:complete
MIKNFLLFVFILILTSCSAPGSAFLGPVFTGAKTGSVYQTSLSYGSGKIMSKLTSPEFFLKNNNEKVNTTLNISEDKNPIILLSYKIDKVEFSELIEPEPLP